VLALPVSFVPEIVLSGNLLSFQSLFFSIFTTNTSNHHTFSIMDVFYAYVRKPLLFNALSSAV
jgi:hypothetical protein